MRAVPRGRPLLVWWGITHAVFTARPRGAGQSEQLHPGRRRQKRWAWACFVGVPRPLLALRRRGLVLARPVRERLTLQRYAGQRYAGQSRSSAGADLGAPLGAGPDNPEDVRVRSGAPRGLGPGEEGLVELCLIFLNIQIFVVTLALSKCSVFLLKMRALLNMRAIFKNTRNRFFFFFA